ncbi:MAG: phosphoglycerate dehydrogenase, partial [Chloroflexi bacterium]|nr:phosphoglycerate dehydrogenase [Chloroflexota bacterium]
MPEGVRHRVLVCDSIAKEGLDVLRAHADVELRLGLRPEQLIQAVDGCHGLVVRSQTLVTAEAINAATNLRVIGRAGVGVDNIDVEAASRKGIIVVNAPMSVTVAAAEHTLAMIFALARHIPQAHNSVVAGRWERSRYLGCELRDKTLGVVGLGHIGSEVARRAVALEMRVVGVDPFVSADYATRLGITLVPMETLLAQSDFVTIHVPLTPNTRNLFGPEQLKRVKPGVRLVNCARGGIIDEAALADALQAGIVAGAALD